MKISVITVCLNSRDYIEDCLQSVIRQNTDNYEHIIIDGVSNDGTLEIIEKNNSPRQIVISEPDKGIYYAMNKGVDAASGDVIGFLNADDVLASPSILADITTFINNTEVDIVYGNIEYRERNQFSKVTRMWNSGPFSKKKLRAGWFPPHPTFYCTRSLYKNYGNYNVKYKIAADVDLMFRFLSKNEVMVGYFDKTMVHMRTGGVSNNSIFGSYRQFSEVRMALKNNLNYTNVLSYLLNRIFLRIKQRLAGYGAR